MHHFAVASLSLLTVAPTQAPQTVPLFQAEPAQVSPDYFWGPNRAIAVDYDGDGDRDLVTTVGNGFVGVLRIDVAENDGRGAFRSIAGLNLTEEPFDLDAGDLDGDGLLDLYVSFPQSTTGDKVFFGTGISIFPFANPRAIAGPGSDAVQLVDVDGDGDLDVVQTGLSSVGVRWNDGFANFAAGPTYAVQGLSGRVLVFDADGDGDPDCLAQRAQPPAAILLRNDGVGNWIPDPVAVSSGFFHGAAATDVDGDGDTDIVLARNATATYHDNDGSGNFGPAAVAGPPLPTLTTGELLAADVDRDGRRDLVFDSSVGIVIWRGQGNGTFVDATAASELIQPARQFAMARQILLEELDHVSGPEIFALDAPRGQLWRNDGSGSFRATFRSGPPAGAAFTVADLDGDGTADALQIGGGLSSGPLVHLRGVGDGSLADVSTATLPALRPGVTAIDLADVDGDGDVDAVIALENPTEFALLQNDGAGRFTVARSQQMAGFGPMDGIAVGDLDGDGQRLDLVTTAGGFINATYSFRDTAGQWLGAPFLPFGFGNSSQPDLVDVDGDGDLDLTFGTSPSPLLRNDGSGSLAFESALSSASPVVAAFADLTGDGVMEVVVAGLSTPQGTPLPAVVRASVGSMWPVVASLASYGSPSCFDVDGDGDRDVLLGGPSTIYLNAGGQGLTQLSQPFGGVPYFESLAPGDFDGDGDIDFALLIQGEPISLVENSTRRLHAPLPADRGFPFVVELTSRQNGGVLGLLGVSAIPARQLVPGLGLLHIGLADLWSTTVPLAPTTNEQVRFDVPASSGLTGLTLRIQAALLEPQPRLTAFREFTIR